MRAALDSTTLSFNELEQRIVDAEEAAEHARCAQKRAQVSIGGHSTPWGLWFSYLGLIVV